MGVNQNKRKLEDVDDALERAYADLKASIDKAVKAGAKYRRPRHDIEAPPTYRVVSRGDDEWRR